MAFGIHFHSSGNFSKAKRYFTALLGAASPIALLNSYGRKGVAALSAATPYDTGRTAASWSYEITVGDGIYRIDFTNDNLGEGWFPIALMLDIGHGTKGGTWVEGRNYIDPAIQPVFDSMADDLWREVRDL